MVVKELLIEPAVKVLADRYISLLRLWRLLTCRRQMVLFMSFVLYVESQIFVIISFHDEREGLSLFRENFLIMRT